MKGAERYMPIIHHQTPAILQYLKPFDLYMEETDYGRFQQFCLKDNTNQLFIIKAGDCVHYERPYDFMYDMVKELKTKLEEKIELVKEISRDE